MQNHSSKISNIGIGFGACALLLALVHFWAGPFSPQPTVESIVSEKIYSIRSAAIDALKGKEPIKESWTVTWDADRIADVVTALMGGLAFVLGIVGFTKSESSKVASGAVVLGVSAIAFQFIAMYVMALLFIMLIGVIISEIGIDF